MSLLFQLLLAVGVNVSQACPWLPPHYYLVGREGDEEPPINQKFVTSNSNAKSKGLNRYSLLATLLRKREPVPEPLHGEVYEEDQPIITKTSITIKQSKGLGKDKLVTTQSRHKKMLYEPLYDEVYDENELALSENYHEKNLESQSRLKDPAYEPLYDEILSRKSELEEIDKDALSKLSDEDRELLLTELTAAERMALLLELEKAKNLPIDENRFGDFATGGFAGIGAKIGAGAGGYLGGRLAGPIGAKLGSAAGAYLGAAAASRLEATFRGRNPNNRGNSVAPLPPPPNQQGFQYGGQLSGSYGTYSG
ncbi:unnamed protein product [Chrysodeixis includens]|uniref:Uncharacterized protein n=1 Tax=Chrysodeixis includens TaxID=689277 RepID=A0A9N8Q0L3_CHRIL|nr:unnamed protein product [Chrysodeixis includens]